MAIAMLVPTRKRVDADALNRPIHPRYSLDQDIVGTVSDAQEKGVKGFLGEVIRWEQFPRGWKCEVACAYVEGFMRHIRKRLRHPESVIVEYGGAWHLASCPNVHIYVPVNLHVAHAGPQNLGQVAELTIDPTISNPNRRLVDTTPLPLVEENVSVLRGE